MRFKVNGLIIDMPPDVVGGEVPPCGAVSVWDPGAAVHGLLLQGPPSAQPLIALRERLRDALAQVEAYQRAVEASLQPQTAEQVDQLEQRLTAALEETRKRKAELQKQPSRRSRSR